VFLVHQQSTGNFLFSARLCEVIQLNQAVLQDIPFTTISLQLITSLRTIKKERDVYTHFHVCCGQFLVILIPWVVTISINTITIITNNITIHNSADISTDLCPAFFPSSLLQFIIKISVVVGIPFLLVMMVFFTTLPNLSTCVGPTTCESNPVSHNTRQDLTLLSVLLVAHLLFQVPTRIAEIFIHYRHISINILNLIVKIVTDLPLVINPLGVLLIRGLGTRGEGKTDSGYQPPISVVNSPSEENMRMIVSLEGKDLEAALFRAKTTSL